MNKNISDNLIRITVNGSSSSEFNSSVVVKRIFPSLSDLIFLRRDHESHDPLQFWQSTIQIFDLFVVIDMALWYVTIIIWYIYRATLTNKAIEDIPEQELGDSFKNFQKLLHKQTK